MSHFPLSCLAALALGAMAAPAAAQARLPAGHANPGQLMHSPGDEAPAPGWDHQGDASVEPIAGAEPRSAADAFSAELNSDAKVNTAAWWRLGLGPGASYAAGGVAVALGKDSLASAPGAGKRFGRSGLRETSCMAPWLQCTAFGSVETRLAGYARVSDGGIFPEDPKGKRRNLVAQLKVGMRFDFPYSRSASHGPWFLQFKITRRTPEFRASSIPVRRHKAGALTVGTEF